jgi:hypothetical protein
MLGIRKKGLFTNYKLLNAKIGFFLPIPQKYQVYTGMHPQKPLDDLFYFVFTQHAALPLLLSSSPFIFF